MSMSTLPAPEQVAERARRILATIENDQEFDRLRTGCALYNKDWQSFAGYPVVENFDAVKDAPDLFVESVRVMSLKAAVYKMTGDEQAAELPVPAAVDEMVHALAAQFTLLSRMQDRTGLRFVHMTDMEQGRGWDFGDYTHQCYRAAFGPVNERYWIGAAETARRRKILNEKYASIDINDGGRRTNVAFAA